VIFHHFFFDSLKKTSTFADSSHFWFSPLALNNGWLGVNIFFILSGMVLYRPNIVLSVKSIFEFYIARCMRLWPLYGLLIICVSVIEGFGIKQFTESGVLLLSGLHDLMPNYWAGAWILWVLWSLGIEILFSALLPLLLLAANYCGFWRVFGTILIFSFFYRIVGDHVWFALHPDFSNRFINPLKDNIFGRLDDFMVGMATAKLIAEHRKPASGYLGILGIIGVLLVCNLWAYLGYVPRTLIASVIASGNHLAFSLSLCAIIISFRGARLWQSPFLAPIEFAGVTCYSAYIMHAIILRYTGFQMTDWRIAPFQFILFVAMTFALSAITFALVEAPGIKHLPQWAFRINIVASNIWSRCISRFN
jgi:peptidoglycan/LPS O-acetylase OafA/YrhL